MSEQVGGAYDINDITNVKTQLRKESDARVNTMVAKGPTGTTLSDYMKEILKQENNAVAESIEQIFEDFKKKIEDDVAEAKKTRQSDIDKLDVEIAALKVELAAAKAAPPSSVAVTAKDAEIAALKVELAAASSIQAKIDPILTAFKDPNTKTVPHDKYTIKKLDKGFEIILT